MRLFLLFPAVVLLCGCASLPPGEAPDGPIVKVQTPRKAHSWRGAENYLITSLSAFCLQNFPEGTAVCTDFPGNDSFTGIRSRMILYAVCDSVPLELVGRANAEYSLKSRINKAKIWSMSLTELKTKEAVWQERVKVKIDR